MTPFIVFLATPVSFWMLARRGLEQAFLKWWLPLFLSMPTVFTAHIPMVPLRTFLQAAIVPLLLVLLRDRRSEMRFGRMETLLALYVLLRVSCDFMGRGYSDAQNYAAYMLTALIGPYLLGRYVIDRRQMDIDTARRFVLMFLLFFPMFLYEAKFWVSPVYAVFARFFPDAFSGLSVRWGLARTAGTFEHPILACIMIIAVYRLHRWLGWQGVWDQPQDGWLGWIQARASRLPLAFEHQISVVLILMALMTISRGPWIGGFAGAALAAVGNCKDRRKWLVIVVSAFVLGGLAGQAALDAYITPGEGEILSDEAQTMLYRKVMIDQYKVFLIDRMWTGWGLTTVPTIKGMESVDNAFFLMALQHGVLAPALFILVFVYAIVSQIRFGLQAPMAEAPIGFTFSGIYLACFIAFFTVYMGAQTEPMLFLLLGWGESIKNRESRSPDPASRQATTLRQPFRRVIH